jgi:L-asparaginase
MTGPDVSVLALGGTIAMTTGAGGVTPTLSASDLIAAVPGLGEVATITAESFRQVPGAHLGFDDIEALAERIEAVVRGGAAGVVVTQGTDTIEETAFALDCLLALKAPVVVTGAMRNPTLAGPDGPANLMAAVRVAASDRARDLGVLVVMGDEIHAARFCRKTHTANPAAFASPLAGQIGWVSENTVRVVARVTRVAMGLRAGKLAQMPVALVTLALGDDGRLIDASVDLGYRGLVVEAMGGGHATPAAAEAIERAATSIPVILASRVGTGEVLGSTYGFIGSEIDLVRRGALRAGWLDGLKARILLSLALRHGLDHAGVRQVLSAWGGDPL